MGLFSEVDARMIVAMKRKLKPDKGERKMTSVSIASESHPEMPTGVSAEQGLCWMRSCPHCQRTLIRSWPWVVVRCACGWQWGS